MEIEWIYYGFSGAIANFVVWTSLFFPSVINCLWCCLGSGESTFAGDKNYLAPI
jgi:hypothetical protein